MVGTIREEGLSNPGVPELRGLITPPLEGCCKLAQPEYQFQRRLPIIT